ncbi:MAG: hypothetical protein IKU96_01690 [Alistipes sp.]|nr:hypothetical protein [Alistipes sp.]
MKKLFSMMAVLAAMFAFVACTDSTDEPAGTKGKLATPELTSTTTETSFTVAWNAVSGADAYIVNFDGKNYTVAECSYTVENLNAGDYTVRVKATGKGYEDSDSAKIVVSVSGIKDCKWFTQELFLAEDSEEGITKANAVWFTWKGTGIADVQYGLFETAALEGASDKDIKDNLNTFDAQTLEAVLGYINGAEGFTNVFTDTDGSTSYTLCTLVTNEDGIEFLAKSEITTEEAELTAATQRWIGTYTAKTDKMVNINSDPTAVTDQVSNFTFTVTAVPGTSDEVDVYGVSNLSADLPAFGYVVSEDGVDYLCITAFAAVSEVGNGVYACWFPFCETAQGHTFVTGEFIAYAFAMDAQGNITYQAGNGELSSGAKFTVVAHDFLGYDGNQLYLMGDANGNDFVDWKYGPISNVTKTEATAAVANREAMNLSVNKVLPASVVVAM